MTLKEYYNLPEDTNVTLNYVPSFFDVIAPGFQCPPKMSYAFAHYQGTSIPKLNTEGVYTMTSMFYDAINLKSLDLSNLNTSDVTLMSSMFEKCSNCTFLNVTGWDTSKVTSMTSMFKGCSYLATISGIENWDTSNVTSMDGVFDNCKSLTSIDLSKWNTSNVKKMANMFNGCTSLTSVSSIRADNLSISTYENIFGNKNTVLTDFGGFVNLKNNWNGNYGPDKMEALSHQSLLNILNGLYDFVGNSQTPTSSQGNLKLGTAHLAKLTDEEKAIATSKGWVLS